MEFSIKIDTVKWGWSIILRGHRLHFPKNTVHVFLSLKSDFVLVDSADSD